MEITKKKKKIIAEIAEKYGLKLVVLFGSQVHGRTHSESDIDIGVLPSRALSFYDEARIATEFIHLFGMRADFTNLYKASPLLLSEVTNNCTVLYQQEVSTYTDFFVYAKQRFMEAAPIYAMTNAAVRRFADKKYDR